MEGKSADKLESEAAIMNDFEKKIIEAFEVFDHGGNKTVDVREVGTIIRSLGCCPSEAEIQEVIVSVEDNEITGSVHLSTFLPVVSNLISEYKFQPASPEELLKAFETLDKERKGYLEPEYLKRLMMEEGEPFIQEEIDEMMAAAVDSETGMVQYEYYLNQIMDTSDVVDRIRLGRLPCARPEKVVNSACNRIEPNPIRKRSHSIHIKYIVFNTNTEYCYFIGDL